MKRSLGKGCNPSCPEHFTPLKLTGICVNTCDGNFDVRCPNDLGPKHSLPFHVVSQDVFASFLFLGGVGLFQGGKIRSVAMGRQQNSLREIIGAMSDHPNFWIFASEESVGSNQTIIAITRLADHWTRIVVCAACCFLTFCVSCFFKFLTRKSYDFGSACFSRNVW